MAPAQKSHLVNEKGQALLIVLLSMAVVLTVALSIVARSITDVTITSQEEDSLRAFSAAEAGIEKSLITGAGVTSTVDNATFETSVSGYAESTNSFVFPISFYSGESVYFWLVNHDENEVEACTNNPACFTGNKLKICWGKEGTSSSSSNTPAIEGSLFYFNTPGIASTMRIARFAVDPNSSRLATNFFSGVDAGTCLIDGISFQFHKTINMSDLGIPSSVYTTNGGLRYLKVRFFYNSDVFHPLGITSNVDSFVGSDSFPVQGQKVTSLGTSGNANRKIEAFKGFLEIPNIFDSVVFDMGGGVSK